MDDLRRRPAELEVGEADLALALRAQHGGSAEDRGGGGARLQELATPDVHRRPPYALTFGRCRSASSIFSAGYS